MAQILVWFASTLGARVLLSLGMGFISYGSITVAAQSMISAFSASWGGVPSAILQIASLAGIPTAIGFIAGAWLARLSLNSLSKIGKLPT